MGIMGKTWGPRGQHRMETTETTVMGDHRDNIGWRQWRPHSWGPHGDHMGAMGTTGMTWGQCGDDGDNVGTMGTTCRDNEITKNANNF